MKKILFIVVMSFPYLGTAQKEFSHWITGGGTTCPATSPIHGTNEYIFSDTGTTIIAGCRNNIIFYDTNASICDSEGNLLFYTNGSHIYDKNDNIMPNGDSLSYGAIWHSWGLGYPCPMGAMILPLPDNDSLYYVFTELAEELYMPTYNSPGTKLSYTVVNRYLHNGLGAVTQKEIPIIQDTLSIGTLTACRHANGRDWWIVIPECATNCIYTCLFTPTGISNVQKQCLGYTFNQLDWNGQACFSPDGNWYARNTPYDDLHLYRFDRCTGVFSNPLDIYFNGNIDYYVGYGVAFSPNSRFLYSTTAGGLYQYDLSANNLSSTRVLVDTCDFFQDPALPITFNFYSLRLAPDHKIYMNSSNSNLRYGLINSPDSLGVSCNFQEHLRLPRMQTYGLPNFPYYQLGAALGSSCDTLGSSWAEVSSLEFGEVRVCDSLSLTTWIYNTGTGTMSIDADTTIGSAFSVIPDTLVYIAAGDSLEVTITFQPTTIAPYADLVEFQTNLPNNVLLQIPVTGIGTSCDTTAAAASLSVSGLNFGDVGICDSLTLPIWIYSTGTDTLSVSAVAQSGSVFGVFPSYFSVLPGDSLQINIAFNPLATNPYSNFINFETNIPNTPLIQLPVTGTGISCDTIEPIGVLSVSGLHFGNVRVCDSLALPLWVHSTGNGALSVQAGAISGSPFAVIPAIFNIPAGDSMEVLVQFKPTAELPYSELLNFQTNMPGNPVLQLGVTGIGTACDTAQTISGALSVSGLQFGGVHLGDSLTLTALVHSTGTGSLHVQTNIPAGSAFSITPVTFTVGAGASQQISVKFKPNAAIPYAEFLPMMTNIANTTVLQLPVTGIGLLPDAIASPDPSEGGETRQIRLFPNPLRDWMFLEGEFAIFELYDMMGRKVLESREKKVSLTDLPKGLYMVRLKDKNGKILKTEKINKL